jgi:hypothetical protein
VTTCAKGMTPIYNVQPLGVSFMADKKNFNSALTVLPYA